MSSTMSGMILTINLEGSIGGFVEHRDLQRVSVQLSNHETLSRIIEHSNRKIMECTKVTNISEEVIAFWESNECPYWESPKRWGKMNKGQRLFSYLDGFDEGFGFSFEFIE